MLIAAAASLPGGLASAENSHPPQTPFSAMMEGRSQSWSDAFIQAIASGVGYQAIPVSDALTPPVAITGTIEAPSPVSPKGLFDNPLVAGTALVVLAVIVYKTLK